MNEVVLLLAAVAGTAVVTSWLWRQWSPGSPPPPSPDPRIDRLIAEVEALASEVARVVPALEGRLGAIERRQGFDPSAIVGRLAAIEGGLTDLKKARAAALDLQPVLAAIAEIRPSPPSPAPEGDDLSRIKGIGPKMLQQLAKLGIRTYREIADWTPDDVARMDAQLEARGRIERDRWVEQCRELVNGPR